jgi:hypothetical protein
MTRRRRRHGPSGDSLELLLDTICNTFGGIVFIALLIVLLLQQTAVVTQEPTDEVSPAELERLASELEVVDAELASLRTARDDLAKRAEEFAPDDVRALMRNRNRLTAETDLLRSDADKLAQENAVAVADLTQEEMALNSSLAAVEKTQKAVEELREELDRVRKSFAKEIRNPLVRESTTFRSLDIIVRYGRMYVWHNYDREGNELGLNTRDFVVTGEESGALVTHPDPTRGIPLKDDPASAAAILDQLKPFPSSRFYITVVVRSDSFRQFAGLRDVLIGSGYEYRLMPTNGPVVDRGGTDSKVQ